MGNEAGLPEVGKSYFYEDTPVTITGVHKRGRGHYVTFDYEGQVGPNDFEVIRDVRMRLKDWQKGARQ